MAKKITTTVYITEEQNLKLKELNERTKVPVAEYIREGINLVLERHKNEIAGQMSFDDLVKVDKE
ncbi:MAG: ribbon-helix-helix domain-containing protein [bacterium]